MEIRKLEKAGYEAPVLMTVGTFDRVTLGPLNWGFEIHATQPGWITMTGSD